MVNCEFSNHDFRTHRNNLDCDNDYDDNDNDDWLMLVVLNDSELNFTNYENGNDDNLTLVVSCK